MDHLIIFFQVKKGLRSETTATVCHIRKRIEYVDGKDDVVNRIMLIVDEVSFMNKIDSENMNGYFVLLKKIGQDIWRSLELFVAYFGLLIPPRSKSLCEYRDVFILSHNTGGTQTQIFYSD